MMLYFLGDNNSTIPIMICFFCTVELFSGLPQPEHCLETVVMGEESPMWSLFVQIGDGSTATINAPRDKLLVRQK